MNNWITLQFWFSYYNPPLLRGSWFIFLSLSALLLLLVIFSGIIRKKSSWYRKLWNSLFNFSLANLIVALVLMFFHYEATPFLTARFWLGLWAIIMIVWLVLIIKRIAKIPQIKKEKAADKLYRKYLP